MWAAFCQHVFGRYHTPARFDRLFASTSDPWRYHGDPISEHRRELILSLLPRQSYPRMLEIGCAEGWMTSELAARAVRLVAADFSRVAIARARERCRCVPNVSFARFDLLNESLVGSFDCIVCAGVLVLLPGAKQQTVPDRLVLSLASGGDLILEHTRCSYPGAVAGDKIHRLYGDHPELALLQHHEAENYAVTVFRRVNR